MDQQEQLLGKLAAMWIKLGYTVEKRDAVPPLNIHMVAWACYNLWSMHLYYYRDLWVVCSGSQEVAALAQERKEKLRKQVERESARRLIFFSIPWPQPYVNVVVLTNSSDPAQEVDCFAPDVLVSHFSIFYTATAFNLDTQQLIIRRNWLGSRESIGLLQTLAQELTGNPWSPSETVC